MNDDVLLQRLEEKDADCARVAAENAELWEEVQALRKDERMAEWRDQRWRTQILARECKKLTAERDALAAHVERLKLALDNVLHEVGTHSHDDLSDDERAALSVLGATPATSFARLKAEWQADILYHLMHEALIEFDDWEKEVKPIADELRRQAKGGE